jgi:hypothetical protein
MSNYFEKLPTINYLGRNVKDISRRVNFMKKTISNPYVFLPYTVEEGDRPEDIAHYYYGSTDYTWLVYLSNNMIDPYHDWPLSQENFDQYLIQKYQRRSGRKGYEVIDWLQDENITENVVYYYKEVSDDVEDVGEYIPPPSTPSQPESQPGDFDNTKVVINGITYTLVKN